MARRVKPRLVERTLSYSYPGIIQTIYSGKLLIERDGHFVLEDTVFSESEPWLNRSNFRALSVIDAGHILQVGSTVVDDVHTNCWRS